MNLNTITISALTREKIHMISSGEVTSSNIFDDLIGGYDEEGLFSKKIFGLINDFTCKCSDKPKPEKIGKTCSQCGSLYEKAKRRDKNYGHIDFAVPLIHPIFETNVESMLILPPAYRPAYLDVTSNFIIPEDITKVKEYEIRERIKPRYDNEVILITFALNDKDFEAVFNPASNLIQAFQGNEEDEGISYEEITKFANTIRNLRDKLQVKSNSNNPIFKKLLTSNQIKAAKPRKNANKQQIKDNYKINFNITDINYLYSKLIEYNNTIKRFIEYKSNDRIYDLYKYCHDNYRKNIIDTNNKQETNDIINSEQETNQTKGRIADEKDLESLIGKRNMRRDKKCEIIKQNHKPVYNFFKEQDRFTEEQYDKFRAVYRYFFKNNIKKDTPVSKTELINIINEQISKHTAWMQDHYNVLILERKKFIERNISGNKEKGDSHNEKMQNSLTDDEESLTVEGLLLEEDDRLINVEETEEAITIDESPDKSNDSNAEEDQSEYDEENVNENESTKNNIDQEEFEDILSNKKEYKGRIDIIKDLNYEIKVKSLVTKLTGKNGHFRDAALGKRVDYSGRSVIVVEPDMKLNEMGLPYEIAIKLFEPNIIKEIKDHNTLKLLRLVKNTKLHIERKTGSIETYFNNSLKFNKLFKEKYFEEIWDILEKIMENEVVLLVRNPSLHRMNIQAFKPKLISDKAIKFHPLVLKQFGADIDGDTMAAFVPLSTESKNEAKSLLMSGKYLFSPSNGEPVTSPSQDMLLGLYFLTKQIDNNYEASPVFSNISEVILCYNNLQITSSQKECKSDSSPDIKSVIHKNIRLRHQGSIINTTIGRAIFNNILPKGFRYINTLLKKKVVNELIKEIYSVTADISLCNKIVEDIKDLGLKYATSSGMSIGLDAVWEDFVVKEEIDEIEEQKDSYYEKSKSPELTNELLDIREQLNNFTNKVKNDVFTKLENINNGLHPLQIMLDSGARGTEAQIMQILGIKGYLQVSKCITDKREFNSHYYITSSYNKGYKRITDYIVSVKMARKLAYNEFTNVPMTGYLERKLIYFADDIVIKETDDCGTINGVDVKFFDNSKRVSDSELTDKLYGRVLNENVLIPLPEGRIEMRKGEMIDYKKLKTLLNSDIEKVNVRSPLKCISKNGCCAVCYGMDLARAKLVKLGTPVGVIAAQSIGEPSTQLQLKNFHTGGVFQESKIEDSFEIISSIFHGTKNACNYLIADLPKDLPAETAKELQKEIMVETIYKTFQSCGASINTKHIELIIKQFAILDNKYRIVRKSLLENSQDETIEKSYYYKYKGITDLSNANNCALKKLSYQNIPKFAKNIVENQEYDDFSSMASRKIAGKLINAGTGMTGDAYLEE